MRWVGHCIAVDPWAYCYSAPQYSNLIKKQEKLITAKGLSFEKIKSFSNDYTKNKSYKPNICITRL